MPSQYAIGTYHFFLIIDGKLKSCGFNTYQQLGIPHIKETDELKEVSVFSQKKFLSIYADEKAK